LIDLVVHGSIDRPQESLVGIGREINRDSGSWCDRSRNFDVEHHFTIGSVGVAGRAIPPTVYTHAHYFGTGNSQLSKIAVQITDDIPATKLDDADALTRAADVNGKIV
jgi:hypothetical protein